MLAALIEENGEVARELNHLFGNKKKKSTEEKRDLGKELADMLFAICCIANSQNIDLDEYFQKTMEKSQSRDANRFEKK